MKNINKNKIIISLAIAFIFSFASLFTARAEGPEAVNLGGAGNFVILAKTGISTTGTTSVVGDLGVSPAAATYITGFGLNLPAASAFSTSAKVSGKIYAPGYASPTPSVVTTAVSDMQTAYTNANGRTNPTATELGAGNIGGLTIAPGLYKWTTGVTIPTDVTLSGSANDVWIFQIAQNLNISANKKIILSGGAQANNIFWIVAGKTTIETGANFSGNILGKTAIVLNTGASLNGRALAQTAVTLDANTVTIPTYTAPILVSEPAPAPISNPIICDYAAPSAGCNYVNGPNYNSTTHCGMILSCQNSPLPPTSDFGQQIKAIAISLRQGGRGNNVEILQQFLISQNKGSASLALSKVGATAYFGPLTRKALAEFQAKVGINPPLGNFGPITRAYLSTHY